MIQIMLCMIIIHSQIFCYNIIYQSIYKFLQFNLLISIIDRELANMKNTSPNDNFDISWIQKDVQCWIYLPQQQYSPIYIKGVVKAITPLSFNRGNSKVLCMLENGTQHETKAGNLQKRRHSSSIQKDLISLEIINPAQILYQLRRRLQQKKIHIYMWNSLIIVNPFVKISEMYDQKVMRNFYEKVIIQKKTLPQIQPHIYGFVCNILNNMKISEKAQMISISGQSGSGKTETNKQCLKIISFVCQINIKKSQQATNYLIQQRILNCDSILECFGNAKTSKNQNSSRFGKLITEKINQRQMQILQCDLKVFFLQKSRIIHQSYGQRNFHIFYQLYALCPQNLRNHLGLKSNSQFKYFSNKVGQIREQDKVMWNNLLRSFQLLQISQSQRNQIFQIITAVLHLGNLRFSESTLSGSDPCDIENDEIIPLISTLLSIETKFLKQGLLFNKKIMAGQLMYIPMSEKQCEQGRDSMAKALYQNLFFWIVDQLNKKVNQSKKPDRHVKVVKMLDIYGFQVFQFNSFEQLCVNYTNQRIHQIYLDQVFKHQKTTLRKQGLQSIIPQLKFTDNSKIIQLLDTSVKSIFNLLDQNCSINAKDQDFLNSVKKMSQGHQNFPGLNNVTLKKCFIITHTPGDIQYMVLGFRAKNKDFLRQDIAQKLSISKSAIIGSRFLQIFNNMKLEVNKKFLGFKIRKQITQLMNQMSTNSDMHFIRCIKPNDEKQALTFVERVCYNQIKYLGVLDTVRMRKDCYHVRIPYRKFYQKFGILRQNIKQMIKVSQGSFSDEQCKQMSKGLMESKFKGMNLDYLYGLERMFLKMQTNNYLQSILKLKTKKITHSSTIIKVFWRSKYKLTQRRNFTVHVKKVQKALKSYLRDIVLIKRKNAVKKIEEAWLKNYENFFRRKKRIPIMAIQKYIKRAVQKIQFQKRYNSILYAKQMILSIPKVHKEADRMQDFQGIKQLLNTDIYDSIWMKMRKNYANKLSKYFKSFLNRAKNRIKVISATQKAQNRLLVKSKADIQKYLRVIHWSRKFQNQRDDIIKVQRFLKMALMRRKYESLRQKVIKIQRAWRDYKYQKEHNCNFTTKYFQSNLDLQKQWKSLLHRNLKSNNLTKQVDGVEGIFQRFEKIKKQKIILFYYLLDFQILYQDHSLKNWIDNYLYITEDALMKLNPIQFIDVSNTHTVLATTNKIYMWGDISLQSQKPRIEQFQVSQGKLSKISADQCCIRVNSSNPSSQQLIETSKNINEHQQNVNRQWATLNQNFVLLNGIVLTMHKISFTKLNVPQKVSQISCGMGHIICRTLLKKVYTWGKNSSGQLGTGDYYQTNTMNPKLVQFFYRKRIPVCQVAASPYGSLVLDSNCKLYWFGSNGTIKNVCIPQQCQLLRKSSYLSNYNKYSPVRIISRWSKRVSIIGLTIACHDDLLKNQISLRKKILQGLITKWNEDINTINPPYCQSVADYISQRHMPLSIGQNQSKTPRALTNKQIRQKIISDIHKIQEAEKQLLRTRKMDKRIQVRKRY